jgi:transposase-like protein
LGNWVRAYREKHSIEESTLGLSDRARLRQLERENRELQQKIAFLEKVSAYFASGQR